MEDESEISIIQMIGLMLLAWYLGYYILGPILVNLIYPEDKETGGCKSKIKKYGEPMFVDIPGRMTETVFPSVHTELSPAHKACIATGICDEETFSDYGYKLNSVESKKWKLQIIDNAEKVFNNSKEVKKNIIKKPKVKTKIKRKK